jgi:capsular exopolysaccharide synthesis family protein
MSEPQREVAVAELVLEETDIVLSDVPPTLAVFLFGGSNVGEGLRGVRARLRLGKKGEIRTLAVTSCIAGDGKTSVAIGLSAAYAQAGQRVLLIDADLRRRDVCPMLGIECVPGLAEWLETGQDVLPLRRVAPGGFHVIAAGLAPCRPELLGSARMTHLLRIVERHFDLVILDSAPLLPVADSLALRDRVGGFLLVVRARHSPREAVLRTVAVLGRRRIVGMVLNAYLSRLPKRWGYHYGYGSSYGYAPRYRESPHV